ncbi:MAG: fused MFS/spermidine synthase [Pseudomonadota bacterium]
MSPRAGRARRSAAVLLMLASGCAGLGYQVVWVQQSALWLGHEAAAVLAVVTAFFTGLALGSLALGRRIENSAHALRWYIGCELVIGAWSLVLNRLMSPASGLLLQMTGLDAAPFAQWSIAFGGTLLLLLPATAAMGATLPAMERLPGAQREQRSIAGLYAANTLGAVLGVLLIAFLLAPRLGLARTTALCAVLNLLCAMLAAVALPRATPPVARAVSPASGATSALWPLAFTGLLGIGYEVLMVRALSQLAEDTVYTFALLLAVYLLGTSAGAACYTLLSTRLRDTAALARRLHCGVALSCLAGIACLQFADTLRLHVARTIGGGVAAQLTAEAAMAVLVFALPTLAMGALFSHLTRNASRAGASFGHAIGINTLGAALAPVLFGIWALPLLGTGNALLLVVAGYLVLAMTQSWRSRLTWVVALATIATAFVLPPLRFITVPEGGHVVSYREGVMAAVSVVEDDAGVRRLRINNRQQEGSNATLHVDARQAWIPLLLHPAPARVLFLGLGTGVTAASAAADPSLQVDVAELLPEVVAAMPQFTEGSPALAPTRLHVFTADARRYVRGGPQHYDVIVSDNFHPARSGSGSLYTVEHFRAVRARLASGGVFCQWLPLHQLDLATLRSIVHSFITVFPRGTALLASNSLETPVLGLVGRAEDTPFPLAALRERVQSRYGLEDFSALFGSFVAGPESLRNFSGTAPLNTDDHPVVAYLAPRITYLPDSLPRDRLLALLREVYVRPTEVLDAPDEATSTRLAAYWHVRDRYLALGRDVQPSADVRVMLSQLQAPLLALLHESPDFRPAYDPLLQMARALAPRDNTGARQLLQQLATLQPARAEARESLQALSSPALHD